MKPCELFSLVPKEKLDYLFEHSNASAELDFTFLGFEDVYRDVLNFVSRDKTIIDLGCGYAAQSYYFQDHREYIGVDACGDNDSVIHTENSEFYFMSIQDFIKDVFPVSGIDPKDVFAVCSYVPDATARKLVMETFPYCRVYYPDSISVWKLPEGTLQAKPTLLEQIRSASARTCDFHASSDTSVKTPNPER